MSGSRARRLLACVLVCEGLLGGRAVLAQAITFRRVVDTNTPIPGGTGNFTSLDRQPSVRGGNVAFRAEGANGQAGAYTEISGTLGVVADTSTSIPGGSGFFMTFGRTAGFGSISFDGVSVVFRGAGSANQDGIYTNEGGTLRVVADTNTPIPGGTGNFVGFRFDPSIDSGNIAFVGGDTADEHLGSGVYVEVGGVLGVVADSSTRIPGGSGSFSLFDIVSMDGTAVAFRSLGSMFLGLVTHIGGTFNVVMDMNTPIPGDTGTFNVFGAATLDAGNVVVLGGKGGDLTGVYTDLGGSLRVVADKNTPLPSGTGNFTSFFFGPVAAIDNGNIAFKGAGSGSVFGVYAEIQGSLVKVVVTTDTLEGAAPVSLDGGPEAMGGNEVAFWAAFADGSEAIFVATIPLNVCGNGIVESGEQCDDQGASTSCNANCTFAGCGNGTLDAGEECDDGNLINGDGCQDNCLLPVCGDGVVDPGEECDDGNSSINGHACRADCTMIRCGDGIVDPGEECDDGNLINGDGCQAKCLLPVCGDGIVDPGEQCDDGNLVDGDGCSSNCTVESSGSAIPTVSQWGLVVMGLLLLIAGKVYFRANRGVAR